MNTTDFLSLLRQLREGVNPLTGEAGTPGSCLDDPDIQEKLDLLERRLVRRQSESFLDEAEITALGTDLRALGYEPTAEQLANVFIGSRRIVDPRLRGLPAYRRYRGVLTRRVIRERLRDDEHLIVGVAASTPKPRSKKERPWRALDFFTSGAFDKLTEAKATELYREVTALGLRKPTDRLPAYMAKARTHLPRSFEPWTRAERALLIEAMCYTNDSEKLASVFGRSPAAVREEGKRLIWDSQQTKSARQ